MVEKKLYVIQFVFKDGTILEYNHYIKPVMLQKYIKQYIRMFEEMPMKTNTYEL